MIHEAAAKGFERGADEYEVGRPGYPQAIVPTVGILPGHVVVDVGAGTGKFTRLLVAAGADVIAVEPVDAMRRKLGEVLPGIRIVEGTGESMPVEDGVADAITAAQAFHWFDPQRALDEAARVLREGGTLALVWNVRDPEWPPAKAIDELMSSVAGDAPRFRRPPEALRDHAAFTDHRHVRLSNPVRQTVETMRNRISSVSYVSSLADDRRAEVLAEVERIVAGLGDEFVEPYLTDVYWCTRR